MQLFIISFSTTESCVPTLWRGIALPFKYFASGKSSQVPGSPLGHMLQFGPETIIQFFNFLWKTLILHWLLVLRILPNKPVTWIFKWWHWDCVLCAEGLCEASWSARVLIEESVPQGSKTQSHFCYTSVPTCVWWATWRVIVLLGRSLVSHQKGQNPGLQQEALCSSQINGI